MSADKNTPAEGQSCDGSIEYDRETQVRRFVEGHSDVLCDLAGEGREYDDLEKVAEKYRELADTALFVAEVIETLGTEE